MTTEPCAVIQLLDGGALELMDRSGAHAKRASFRRRTTLDDFTAYCFQNHWVNRWRSDGAWNTMSSTTSVTLLDRYANDVPGFCQGTLLLGALRRPRPAVGPRRMPRLKGAMTYRASALCRRHGASPRHEPKFVEDDFDQQRRLNHRTPRQGWVPVLWGGAGGVP